MEQQYVIDYDYGLDCYRFATQRTVSLLLRTCAKMLPDKVVQAAELTCVVFKDVMTAQYRNYES